MRLNEEVVKALPAPAKGYRLDSFGGAVLQGQTVPRGFGVRVTAAGVRSFVLSYRHGHQSRRLTIGQYPDWSVLKAVREARELRQRIDRGEDPGALVVAPKAVATVTVADVLEDFLSRYGQNLRSVDEYRSAFDRLVKPSIGVISIHALRRAEIVTMLDCVEKLNGPVMADRTLAYTRKAFNWYTVRDETFVSPIVRGLARTKPSESARSRVLSDTELKALWPLLTGTFGEMLKVLLLTAQRCGEVSGMRWTELGADWVWTIPADRYKTKKPVFVPLSEATVELIQQRSKDRVHVFASGVDTPYSAFSKNKKALDRASGVSGWTIHDLRRTAKTLMVRAGVRPDISERVLGHAIAGVEGTYDRYSYHVEKKQALKALAEILRGIVE